MKTRYLFSNGLSTKEFLTLGELQNFLKKDFASDFEHVEYLEITRNRYELGSQCIVKYRGINGRYHYNASFKIDIQTIPPIEQSNVNVFYSLEKLLAVFNSLVTWEYSISIEKGGIYLCPKGLEKWFIGTNNLDAKEYLVEKIKYTQYTRGILP